MCYNRLGQRDGKDPSEHSISIINLLDKVSAPRRISEYIISSLISHHHAKILIGIKQKQMAEKWGGGRFKHTGYKMVQKGWIWGAREQNYSLYYLISAFLQQAFYKLPVCLCNYWWREVREFGLPNGAAQIPGFLDVLLDWGRKRTNTDKSASETTWPREKGKLILITHTSGVRRKQSGPLFRKGPLYIQHYLGLRHLNCYFTRGQIPIYIVHTVLEHTLLNYRNTIQAAKDIQMHRDSITPCTTANCLFIFFI